MMEQLSKKTEEVSLSTTPEAAAKSHFLRSDNPKALVKPLGQPASIVDNTIDVVQNAPQADENFNELLQTLNQQGEQNKIVTHLVPLSLWLSKHDALLPLATQGKIGVWLSVDEDPAVLQNDISALPTIGFYFPHFKFGQPYSSSVLLRTRMGFKGHIRAFGDVGQDQLFYLARCGFTEFVLKPGKSFEAALKAFQDFTTPYQTSADGHVPVFHRRHA